MRRLLLCVGVCTLMVTAPAGAAFAGGLAAYQVGVQGDTVLRYDLIVPSIDCSEPTNRLLVLGAIFGEGEKISWSTDAQLTADCTPHGARYRLVLETLTKGYVLRTRPGQRVEIVLRQGSRGESAEATQDAQPVRISDASVAIPSSVNLNVLHDERDAPFSPVRFRRITVDGRPFSETAPTRIMESGMRTSALSASGEGFTVRFAA